MPWTNDEDFRLVKRFPAGVPVNKVTPVVSYAPQTCCAQIPGLVYSLPIDVWGAFILQAHLTTHHRN
jgi:hypothetical protein